MERQRHQEFTSVKQELEQAEQNLKRELERTEKVFNELQGRQEQGIDSSELLLYSSFGQRQRDAIKDQRQAVDVLDQEVETRRDKLLDAAKEKKVLEKFKERQQLAFKLDLAMKERKFVDELATQKTGHEP